MPKAANAILMMHPAAMHPPATASPTASSDFPEVAKPKNAPIAIAIMIIQNHIIIEKCL